jgi:hypothetical protein
VNRGNNLVALLHNKDVGTIGCDAAVTMSPRSIGIGEFYFAKVADGHIFSFIILIVFDDPLCILLTKWSDLGVEYFFYMLLFGQVLDLGFTTIGRSRGDCEPDLVTRVYGKAVEGNRILRKPLRPS